MFNVFFLSFLQVVYMDFIDFNGNSGSIDYRLPRMAHIKNADFKHLIRVDRKITSRKAYGVLPVCISFFFVVVICTIEKIIFETIK